MATVPVRIHSPARVLLEKLSSQIIIRISSSSTVQQTNKSALTVEYTKHCMMSNL